MYKNKMIFILVILNILMMVSGISYAEGEKHPKKVYMIVADKLTLEDIGTMNKLKELTKSGSVGLMNTRGDNNGNTSEGFLSINSSARAYGVTSYANAFNLDDNKLSLYKKRVGFIEDNKYQIGNTEINRILEANLEGSYDAKIGALGDNIHARGLKTAVFGNSDTDELSLRMGSLIPMDNRGLIDYGNVDNILLSDESYPYGIKTDYNKILNEIETVKNKASLIVIDTGDLKRLDLYNSYLNDETFMNHRKNMLSEMDKFIDKLTLTADDDSLFIFLSPSLENERLKSSKLAPVVIWEKNRLENGVLSSSTTRRTGIISNLDIAPTIAEFLDVPKDDFVGHIIEREKSKDNMEFVSSLDKKTNLVSLLRAPYLKLYNVFTIAIIMFSSLFLIINKYPKKYYLRVIEKGLLTILAVPIVLLLLPLLNISNIYVYILCSLVLLFSMILIVSVIFKRTNRVWALLFVNTLIIIVDISTGSNLTRSSIIGYDPIIGARYFGIGNELVGVLLASVMILVSVLMNKFKSKLPELIFLISVIVVGLPNLGANVGGTISMLFGSIIFVLLSSKVRLNIKRLSLIVFVIILIIFSVGLMDIYINPNPTHLGQTLIMIFEKGPISIVGVIIRKLSVNIRLIKRSTWSKVLYTSLIFSILMFKTYKNRMKIIYDKEKYLSVAFISLISGSVVGFLVNDSGLLLASISSMFMITSLLYLIMTSLEANRE